jgi:DNA/RNA endonuclease YhcR with UshA esterase domain
VGHSSTVLVDGTGTIEDVADKLAARLALLR